MTFEAGPVNPQPFSAGIHTRPAFDVIDVLASAPAAADRLRTLRQDVADKRNLTVPFADRQDANTARGDAERQLQRLLAHRSDGGFGLSESDPRVVAAQQHLDKMTAEAQRLKELDEARNPAWRTSSNTLVGIEQWLRGGVPAGNVLHDDDDAEPPKLVKGESVTDAVERLRRRVRELKADLHRIRSSPFPSSYAKTRMRAQIDALAMQGAPNVSDLVEHDRQIIFPTQQLRSQVYNTEIPSIAFADAHDTVPLIAWLFKPAMIAALEREIDTEADDKSALTHEARQQQEAEVQGDLLAVERDESWMVWQAMSERLPVDHRSDCAPQAILQCRLVLAPRVAGNGTSREHGIDIVDPTARRR